jgi:CHAD domain-containing protein
MAKASEIVGLVCEATASSGIRLVLLTRLKEMCAYRTSALKWSDPEKVHDMRVASRRLRSALKDFLPYLRESKLRDPAERLKRIADALGAVRDQDVAILELAKRVSEAPANVAVGIEHLISELSSKRKTSRAALVKTLEKDSFAQFQSEFETSLDDASKISRRRKRREAGTEKPDLTFREVGVSVIKANFQKLEDLSTSLYSPLKPKPLHRMRIAVKRLRYATKLLAPCWPDGLDPFDKEIARLQTSLGELHDCDYWIAELGERLASAKAGSKATADAVDGKVSTRISSKARKASDVALQLENACLWLLSTFVAARAEHYHSALTYWHDWKVTDFQNRLFAVLDAKSIGIELPTE